MDLLEKHSAGSKSTYGYYFTKKSGLSNRGLWELPLWASVSADHAEEIPYVFGMAELPDDSLDELKKGLLL